MHNTYISWAIDALQNRGYVIQENIPEHIQSTPWSEVFRFGTNKGFIYLKEVPPALALEANITTVLHEEFHAAVPEVIAQSPELNCFLMKDAGAPLRGILKKNFDATLLCKAIEQFTSIQLDVANHVNIFLDMGVPDWRLSNLPELYTQLLSQKDILTADGLLEIEINELETCIPTVFSLCQKLSNYSICQTLVQCDFHDNNILVSDGSQNITFIDLGEIVISHPFFSLIGCLRQAKLHHALTDIDDAYLQLIEACLKNYLKFESRQYLLDVFLIASKLWPVYEALAQYRLRSACDEAKFLAFQRHGKLSGRLRELMTVCAE
jgi:hypothetical protein